MHLYITFTSSCNKLKQIFQNPCNNLFSLFFMLTDWLQLGWNFFGTLLELVRIFLGMLGGLLGIIGGTFGELFGTIFGTLLELTNTHTNLFFSGRYCLFRVLKPIEMYYSLRNTHLKPPPKNLK